ncbi:MAG: hypothetical protein HUK13_03885 [Muribaculaceae bacterium]|mgnify:FL=1|nr:hypothetical protein [Muribaculaceae bacterium]
MKKTILFALLGAALAFTANAKTVNYTSATYDFDESHGPEPSIMIYGYEMSIDWNDAMTKAKSIEINHQSTYEVPFFGENVALKNNVLSFKHEGKPVTISFDGDIATAKVGDNTIVLKRLPEAEKCDYNAVDLGLSVDWASYNVGTYDPLGLGMMDNWDCFNNSHSYYVNPWRMPTMAEFQELASKCKVERLESGNTTYYKFTGPNGNSITLPIHVVPLGDPIEVIYWNSADDDFEGGMAVDAEGSFLSGYCSKSNDGVARLVKVK